MILPVKTTQKTKKTAEIKDVPINLVPNEKLALQRQARKFGVTSSELVRIALYQYISGNQLFPNGAKPKVAPLRLVE